MLNSRGKTYDITGAPAQVDPANPSAPPARPRTGYLGINVDGTVDNGAITNCMQGTVLKDIKWSYTRAKCDKPKPEASAASTGKGPACTWQANHDFMPPTPARLAVTGKCMMPTPGYKLTLSKATPQGINPGILVLTLDSQRPSGIVNEVVTETTVQPYEEKTNTPYKTVTILPMGDNVTVKVTH